MLLQEMNSDVKGVAIVANFANLFRTDPSFFLQFQLIVTANLQTPQLLQLSQFCWDNGIALISTRTFGMIGLVRLQLRNHDIIESRIEGDQPDLRIGNPFASLKDYCDSFQLEELDSLHLSHVPYIVLLYKAITKWKENVH
jgi:amyloid beta precursor protein binding protein 1